MTNNELEVSEELWQIALSVVAEFLLANRSCKEYELIQHLQQNIAYTWSQDVLLSLFQKHFIVRHCVFKLNRTWPQDKGLCIRMTPVDIIVELRGAPGVEQLPGEVSASLEAFYFDKKRFYDTKAEEVAELIADFWKRYDAFTQQSEAYQVLGLQEGAEWGEVKQRYRSLAMEAHPDRGGDPQAFARIREAYEQLKLQKGPAP